MKSEVYTRKTDTPDELLAAILDAAARIEKREDLLRRATRDFSHVLQCCNSASRFTVGYSNVCFGL